MDYKETVERSFDSRSNLDNYISILAANRKPAHHSIDSGEYGNSSLENVYFKSKNRYGAPGDISPDLIIGMTPDVKGFIEALPSSLDIFKEYGQLDFNAINLKLLNNLERFVLSLNQVISQLEPFVSKSSSLPPLKFQILDEETVMVEWIFLDFRIGFSITDNPEELAWYLVGSRTFNHASYSGELDLGNLYNVVSKLIRIGLSNS